MANTQTFEMDDRTRRHTTITLGDLSTRVGTESPTPEVDNPQDVKDLKDGYSLFHDGNYSKAIWHFKRVMTAEPTHELLVAAKIGYAQATNKLDFFHASRETLAEIVDNDQDNPFSDGDATDNLRALFLYGESLIQKGRSGTSDSWMESIKNRIGKGTTEEVESDYERALQAFEKGIQVLESETIATPQKDQDDLGRKLYINRARLYEHEKGPREGQTMGEPEKEEMLRDLINTYQVALNRFPNWKDATAKEIHNELSIKYRDLAKVINTRGTPEVPHEDNLGQYNQGVASAARLGWHDTKVAIASFQTALVENDHHVEAMTALADLHERISTECK